MKITEEIFYIPFLTLSLQNLVCNLYFEQISIWMSHEFQVLNSHMWLVAMVLNNKKKFLIQRQTWPSNIPFINSGYTPWSERVQLTPFRRSSLFSMTATEYRSKIEATCPRLSTERWVSQDQHSGVLTPRVVLFGKHHAVNTFSYMADFKYFTTFENTLGLLFSRKTLLVDLHMCLSDLHLA